MKRLIIIILVTFMQSSLVAQKFYGSGAFTEIGFSARSLSLGNTMFSDSDPAVAIYFNPAIVTNRNRKSIHINGRTNNDYFGSYKTFGFYHPFRHSPRGWGLNYIIYNVGDIEGYDEQANFMGNFDFDEYFGSLIFTSSIHNIAWGIKISGIYNNMSTNDDEKWIGGLELGTTYDLELLKLPEALVGAWDIVFFPKIGFMGKRYIHPKHYEGSNNFVPSRLSLGLNVVNILSPSRNFFTEMYYDLSKKYEYPPEYSLGIALGGEIKDIKISFNLGRANVTRDSYKGLSKDLLNELQFKGSIIPFFNSWGISLDFKEELFDLPDVLKKGVYISFAQTYHPYFNQTDYFSVSFYW